jgi:hypothetical protein
MGVWKSLVDRMKDKRDELARKAAKKAAGSVGKAIEKALFGDLDEKDEISEEAPDPFAKLKAAEAEKKERERGRK